MHWGMTLRKCNRLLFDGNTFQFHNCEICEISFFSQQYRTKCWNWEIQSRSVSAVPFLTGLMCDTICQVAAEEAILDARLSHIFHEEENVTFFMKGQITYFLWTAKFYIFFPQSILSLHGPLELSLSLILWKTWAYSKCFLLVRKYTQIKVCQLVAIHKRQSLCQHVRRNPWMWVLWQKFPNPGSQAKLPQENDERLWEDVHLAKSNVEKGHPELSSKW